MERIAVVGGGLAGTAVAWGLHGRAEVRLIDAGGGASSLPAGMVNPFMGRLARPVWQMDAVWSAFEHMMAVTDTEHLFHATGVLRPALIPRQQEAFRRTAERFPDRATWLAPAQVVERFPDIVAPFGALWVTCAGVFHMREWVHGIRQKLREAGHRVGEGVRLIAWREADGGVVLECDPWGRCRVDRLILAPGAEFMAFPELRRLPLHRIKGQLIEVAAPADRPPPLVGSGHAIPLGDRLLLGSTYEHTFTDLQPTEAGAAEIMARVARMWPAVQACRPLRRYAGIRVTVKGIRKPLVGPLTERGRVWICTGLGTRGILMALWIGWHIASWMEAGAPPCPELLPRPEAT